MSAKLDHTLIGAASFRQHLGLGIAYGYPICCTVRFAWGARRGPSGQALARGCVNGRFVPCGIFHRKRPK